MDRIVITWNEYGQMVDEMAALVREMQYSSVLRSDKSPTPYAVALTLGLEIVDEPKFGTASIIDFVGKDTEVDATIWCCHTLSMFSAASAGAMVDHTLEVISDGVKIVMPWEAKLI